jgi:hypothetical protein
MPAATQSAAVAFSIDDGAANARLRALPAPAQRRFEELRRAELRQRAFVDGLYEQQRRVREQIAAAEIELGQHDRQRGPYALFERDDKGNVIEAVDPERVAIVERIAALKSELRRLADDQEAANPGYSTADIRDWLAQQPATANFTAAPVPLIKPTKGESLTDLLTRVRAEQATLRDRIAATESAPLTGAEARASARAQVEAIAVRGRPDVASLFHGGEIGWPTELLTTNGGGHHEYVSVAQVVAAFPFVVWAHKDAVLAAINAEIDAQADDANALSAEVRATAIAEGAATLLDLQRKEERICEMIEETTGQTVRRLNRDPMVLLGIEVSAR